MKHTIAWWGGDWCSPALVLFRGERRLGPRSAHATGDTSIPRLELPLSGASHAEQRQHPRPSPMVITGVVKTLLLEDRAYDVVVPEQCGRPPGAAPIDAPDGARFWPPIPRHQLTSEPASRPQELSRPEHHDSFHNLPAGPPSLALVAMWSRVCTHSTTSSPRHGIDNLGRIGGTSLRTTPH
jgi:hypothetical protein